MAIETVDSKVVYENRWMRVRENAILRGDKPGIYGVVEKADYAIIAAVSDGHIHLVEQYRYPVSARYWELPQGMWEDTPDIDPAVLARAELREETGIVAEQMEEIGHFFQAYGYSNQGVHVFLATGLTQGKTNLDPEEADLISRPVSFAEIDHMVADGRIMDISTVAVLGLLRQRGVY